MSGYEFAVDAGPDDIYAKSWLLNSTPNDNRPVNYRKYMQKFASWERR